MVVMIGVAVPSASSHELELIGFRVEAEWIECLHYFLCPAHYQPTIDDEGMVRDRYPGRGR